MIGYLEAENAWADSSTEHLAGLREQIFGDIRTRTRHTDLAVPRLVEHSGPTGTRRYWYYTRTQEGLQYRIHCRVAVSAGGQVDRVPSADALAGAVAEEILLDENVEAQGQEFFELGELKLSPGGRFLAYGVDTTGGEEYLLQNGAGGRPPAPDLGIDQPIS